MFNRSYLALVIMIYTSFHTVVYTHEHEHETNKATIYKKNVWLRNLVARSRRSYEEANNVAALNSQNKLNKQVRPCPSGCTCSYDTVNCNELIDQCDECVNWHQIDFNQITELKRDTFSQFKFAPNRTTHIIIYKLLNSTLGQDVFNNLNVPQNSQLEITFQYNSVIKLDKFALQGVRLNANSTLVFNFPYTTQVIFVAKCFHGIHMSDVDSRLIVRILKSFSVRFVGDFYTQNFLHLKTARFGQFPTLIGNGSSADSSSSQQQLPQQPRQKLKQNSNSSAWSLSTGQLVIDIKSTHLVKFEENSFAHLRLKSAGKLFLDLDIIEKLMIQRHSFSYMHLEAASRFHIYAKHITFIDFKAFSFSHVIMWRQSSFQIYLEELISSLCVQRNVFSHLRLHEANTHFNFSIINSKNVMLMHDSFSDVSIESATARLFIGVFNSPSYQLKLKTNNWYQSFLSERMLYKWSSLNINDQYDSHFVPPFSAAADADEFFYQQYPHQSGVGSSLLNQVIVSSTHDKQDLNAFYLNNKQTYAYNVSIEKHCFSKINFNYEQSNNANNLNIWIAVDNVKTLLLDDFIMTHAITNETNSITMNNFNNNNINFLLNVKYFVLSPDALQNVHKMRAEFLHEPKIIKFGLLPSRLPYSSPRLFEIIGVDLNRINKKSKSVLDKAIFIIDNLNEEQDDLDSIDTASEKTSNDGLLIIDDYCHLAFASNKDVVFRVESRNNIKTVQQMPMCTCQSVYFYLNQIKDLKSALSLLNCRLTDFDFVLSCRKQLRDKCMTDSSDNTGLELNSQYRDNFLADFIKFWDYCITEAEPYHQQQQQIGVYNNDQQQPNQGAKNYFFSNTDLDTGNLYFNNFNDPDGMFSASLSSSSFFDQPIDSFKPPHLDSDATTQSSSSSSNSNSVASNIGKIIGIVIVSFLSGIILFMIIVNIIQYKFRNELLDDLEYSTNNVSNSSTHSGVNNNRNNDDNENNNREEHNDKLSNPRINNRVSCELDLDKYNETNRNNKKRQENLILKESLTEEEEEDDDENENEASLEANESNLSKVRVYRHQEKYYDDDYDDDYYEDDDENDLRSESDEYRHSSSKEENKSIFQLEQENDSCFEVDYDRDSIQLNKKINKKNVKFFKKSKTNLHHGIELKRAISQEPQKLIKTKLSQDSGRGFSELDSERTSTPPPQEIISSNKQKNSFTKNKIAQA